MVEQTDKNYEPGITRKSGLVFRSPHLATLLTAVFSIVLIFILWIYGPDYRVLMHNLDVSTLAKVTTELQEANIAYQYDSKTGSVLVPEHTLYQARFILGSRGLGAEAVSQLLPGQTVSTRQSASDDNSSYDFAAGKTRYFALETELAKTISSINNIQWARVHLALDESSSDQKSKQSRASVFVRLRPGRTLGEAQLSSISQLIAASVPNMNAENVAVIDHSGNLLKSTSDSETDTIHSRRYSYVRILEQSYINKIESILAPIYGSDALRIRVDADVSFNHSDKPELSAKPLQDNHSVNRLSVIVVIDNRMTHSNDGQILSVSRSEQELQQIEDLVKEAIVFNSARGDRINIFNEPFGRLDSYVQDQNLLQNKTSQYYIKIFIVAEEGKKEV